MHARLRARCAVPQIGDVLTAEQYREVEELGILVDRDDQGVLLQVRWGQQLTGTCTVTEPQVEGGGAGAGPDTRAGGSSGKQELLGFVSSPAGSRACVVGGGGGHAASPDEVVCRAGQQRACTPCTGGPLARCVHACTVPLSHGTGACVRAWPQIFTKPLSDRPTVFIEIIQRVGCMRPKDAAAAAQQQGVQEPTPEEAPSSSTATPTAAAAAPSAEAPGGAEGGVEYEQAAGCGGFGKGNFSELFKSIEDYERTLNV